MDDLRTVQQEFAALLKSNKVRAAKEEAGAKLRDELQKINDYLGSKEHAKNCAAASRAERDASATIYRTFGDALGSMREEIMITVPLIDWQPIATLPEDRKDGRAILITDGEGTYAVAHWDAYAASDPLSNECVGWRDAGDMGWGGLVGQQPTYWADINPPREIAMEQEQGQAGAHISAEEKLAQVLFWEMERLDPAGTNGAPSVPMNVISIGFV